jgi:putative tryptophan/tyrosine transport system substrate-binding protein
MMWVVFQGRNGAKMMRSKIKNSHIIIIPLVISIVPIPLRAQQDRAVRVGMIGVGGLSQATANYTHCFQAAMGNAGWVEGRNLTMEYRWADGAVQRLPALLEEILATKPDVMVALATPVAKQAAKSIKNVPVVFASVSDPVKSGIVTNLAHPAGNITGVSNSLPATTSKLPELLKILKPSISRISVIHNSLNDGKNLEAREIVSAGRDLGISIDLVDLQNIDQESAAFSSLTSLKPEAIIILQDFAAFALRQRIVEFANKNGIPTLAQIREYVEAGALMSYGLNYCDHYKLAAVYVDKILKGFRPSDLPVQLPTKFELLLNQNTARKLGIKIPFDLRARADEEIE